jgi:hypothetical protein
MTTKPLVIVLVAYAAAPFAVAASDVAGSVRIPPATWMLLTAYVIGRTIERRDRAERRRRRWEGVIDAS